MKKKGTKANQETKRKTPGDYGCCWYDLTGNKETVLRLFDKGWL